MAIPARRAPGATAGETRLQWANYARRWSGIVGDLKEGPRVRKCRTCFDPHKGVQSPAANPNEGALGAVRARPGAAIIDYLPHSNATDGSVSADDLEDPEVAHDNHFLDIKEILRLIHKEMVRDQSQQKKADLWKKSRRL